MARRAITVMDPRSIFSRDINDVFNDFTSSWTMSSYSLNMYETDDQIMVEVEAPNFKPEDVDISIEDQTLTVSGHYKNQKEKEQEESEGRRYHYREIAQQSFTRTVTLPMRVKAENAEADFDNGIIRVSLPKAEEVKPKKIAIKTKGSVSE